MIGLLKKARKKRSLCNNSESQRLLVGVLTFPAKFRPPAGFNPFTYLSTAEECFRNRRFPLEIIRPDKYMQIESKHF
jgi:hypothetical protein